MKNSDAATPLRSRGVGRLLMPFAWANVGLGIVSLILSLLQAIAPTIKEPLQNLQGILAVFWLPVILILLVLFLVWMYRLHVDLKTIFADYPITPIGAVARFIIPIYSIWGIWNAFSTFTKRFTQEGGELAKRVEQITPLLGGFYALTGTSNFLTRELLKVERENPAEDHVFLIVMSDVVSVGLSLMVAGLIAGTIDAVVAKARQPKSPVKNRPATR